MIDRQLLEKYDVPAPRYTSYPTVPYWENVPSSDQWISELQKAAASPKSSWSLYLHVPFCETLCTFCGCNTTITRNHKREEPYVQLLLKEWDLYRQQVPDLQNRLLKELHLGGGTPTFLSPKNLSVLVGTLIEQATIDFDQFSGSIEVDPRRTTADQLKALYELGFRRVSMGVQDFNEHVQRLINRIQPREMTEKLVEQSRQMGYTSVNFDLIYGLPKQDLPAMERTVQETISMKPDRIALYSLAVVPWIKPAQRLFKEEDLPKGADKRALYELARNQLVQAGYIEIGMDHFALPSDTLNKALEEKRLHRNFMGYTDQRTDILLGLGVSAISESPTCFHQNEKALPVYERRIEQGDLATLRGHLLTAEDCLHREQILQLMTLLEVELASQEQANEVQKILDPLLQDGLVSFDKKILRVTEKGKPFLRNAAMSLDARLRAKVPETKVFSQAL